MDPQSVSSLSVFKIKLASSSSVPAPAPAPQPSASVYGPTLAPNHSHVFSAFLPLAPQT